jgi:hypothetical protein
MKGHHLFICFPVGIAKAFTRLQEASDREDAALLKRRIFVEKWSSISKHPMRLRLCQPASLR